MALSQMNSAGISVALTSITAPGIHFGDNSEARELARECNEDSYQRTKEHPESFGFFAILPMPDIDGSLLEIKYAFDVLGADGIVLMSSHLDGTYLGDPAFDAVMEELDRRKAVVFVHPQIPTTGITHNVTIPVFAMDFTFDTTRAAFNLVYQGTVERYPNIRFIFAHSGGTVPFLAWRFQLLWGPDSQLMKTAPRGALHYLRQFYYDTALSASSHNMASLLELIGPDHILFGSDYPYAPEPITGASIGLLNKSSLLSDEDREQIYRGTALSLFPRFS